MSAFYPLEPESKGSNRELEVICAGLPRCATNSLKHALQYLGYPTCHMMDIIWWPHRQKEAIALYHETDPEKRKERLRRLFHGFGANSDAPGHSFIDEMMDMYPDAKIILNQRHDPDIWAESFGQGVLWFTSWEYWFFGLPMTLDRLHWIFTSLNVDQMRDRFGLQGKRDWLRDAYIMHNQWVRDEAAKRGRPVLEWQPSDGWEPICDFLGKPVPEVPFPHNNERASMLKIHRQQVRKGLRRYVAMILIMGLVYFLTRYVSFGSSSEEASWGP